MPLTQVQGQMLNGSTNTTTTIQSNGTTAITIDSSQNVGIGTASPGQKLEVFNANGGPIIRATSNATGVGSANGFHIGLDGDGLAYLVQNENQALILSTNATERMRIASNGNVGIGRTSASDVRLIVKGASTSNTEYSFALESGSGASQLFLRNDNYFNSGAIANYSVGGTGLVMDSNNYVGKTTSSLRYKKDIVDYNKGLDAIAKLRPVYYKSAVEGPNGIDPKQHAGFIAEEIDAEGFEEFLVRNQEGEPDAVQYAQMTALLCKAIQELKAELDATKAEVAELKATLP